MALPVTPAREMDRPWLAIPGSVLTWGRLHLAARIESLEAAPRSRSVRARQTEPRLFLWGLFTCFRVEVVSKAFPVWLGKLRPRRIEKEPHQCFEAILDCTLPDRPRQGNVGGGVKVGQLQE